MKKLYKVAVSPVHMREELINRTLAAPHRQVQEHEVYPGRTISLNTILLPIGTPMYRMANGRTRTEQMAYTKRAERPVNFFESGEENQEVQQIQHEILADFAEEGSDSITPIIKILRAGRQQEPILISPQGVVINGNRRLAAMRELYAEDSTKFAHYVTVECAVLPNLTPDQIVELEIRLQMAPETKLPYGWINECLLIQDQVNHGKKEDHIAGIMRKRPVDVRASLGALQEVNIFLKDWAGSPGDYSLVEDGKQFFYDLPKRLKNKSGTILEASRRVAWILFDNSEELGTRVYAFNSLIGDKVNDLLKNLAANSELLGDEEAEEENGDTDVTESLDVDFGTPAHAASADEIVFKALNDVGRREEVAAAVVAVCQTMFEANRTKAQGNSTLRTLSDIQTRLQEIDLTNASPETFPGISRQIKEIQRLADNLATRVEEYLQVQKNRASA